MINGRRYAYEITPYYDKESKRIRQRSRYLGRYVAGEIKRARMKLPRRVFDYGEFLPFMKILEELWISKILHSLLHREKADIILVLALNRAVNLVALCNLRTWYQGTYLFTLYDELPLSSQALSEFLGRIGESSLAMEFSERFIKAVGAAHRCSTT